MVRFLRPGSISLFGSSSLFYSIPSSELVFPFGSIILPYLVFLSGSVSSSGSVSPDSLVFR